MYFDRKTLHGLLKAGREWERKTDLPKEGIPEADASKKVKES